MKILKKRLFFLLYCCIMVDTNNLAMLFNCAKAVLSGIGKGFRSVL